MKNTNTEFLGTFIIMAAFGLFAAVSDVNLGTIIASFVAISAGLAIVVMGNDA